MSETIRRWSESDGTPQLGTLRRLLQEEGLATAWFSEMPGAVVEEHQHPFVEARWVLTGHMEVSFGGGTHVLGPGDRLDVPAATPHRTEVVGLAPVVYVSGAPFSAVSGETRAA